MPGKLKYAVNEMMEEQPLEISLEEEYNPPDRLAIPDMPDSDAYVYRWIRYRSGSEDDFNNVTSRLRDGWKFVQQDEVPEEFIFPTLESKIERLAGCAVNGDLVLAKLPRRRAEAIQRWAETMANEAEEAFNSKTVDYEEGGKRTRFAREGNKTVSRGRRPSFG